MSRQQERRLSQRTRIDRLTYIELPSGNGGIVKDVSESGLGFYAVAPLEGANAVPISIRVSLRGAVKRIHATGDLAWTDGSRKCGGLRFTELPDESVAQIRSWQIESSARPEANGEAGPLRPLAATPKLQPAPQPLGELALQNAEARADAVAPNSAPATLTLDPLPLPVRALSLQPVAASGSKVVRGMLQRFRLPRIPRLPGLRRLLRLSQLPRVLQISRLPSLNTIAFAATFAGRRGPSPLMVAAISVLAGAIGFMSNGWYREMRGDFSSTVASAREASDVVPQVLASSRPAVAAPASAAATNRMFEVAQASAPAPAAAGPVDIGFGADDSKPANLKPTTAALNPKVALASAAGDFIFVEVGAYPRQTEAQGLVEKLRLHNFFAYASGPAKDALYRVQLGPYTTEEAASLAQSALEKAGFSAFVHTASESQ